MQNSSRPWQNDTEVDPLALVQPSAGHLTVSGTRSSFSGWPVVGEGLRGQCDEMCPLRERQVRMQDREVAAFEKEGGPTLARVRDLMVKRFARSSAGHENTAEQLRTPATLGATMQYLTCSILDADSGTVDDRFTKDGPAQAPSLLQVYNFLFDRTRGIRSDYSSQGYGTGRNDALVMQVYEQITRFHVLSNYELCENKEFQRDLNEKELAKALKTLFDLYDDGHKQHEQAVSKLVHGGMTQAQARRTAPHLCSPHEAEMRAFHVLVFMLKDDENTSLNSFLQRCREDVLQAPPMQYALRAMSIFKGGLHASFLRLMNSGPYLLACLMHRALPAVRIKAAHSLNQGFHVKQDIVLDYVGKQLGAASRAETCALAEKLNLNLLGRGKGHCVRSDRRAEAPQLKALTHTLVPQLMPSLPMPVAGMGPRRSIVCKGEWALAKPLPVFGKGASLQPEAVANRVRGLGGSGEAPDAYSSGVVMRGQAAGSAFSGAGQSPSASRLFAVDEDDDDGDDEEVDEPSFDDENDEDEEEDEDDNDDEVENEDDDEDEDEATGSEDATGEDQGDVEVSSDDATARTAATDSPSQVAVAVSMPGLQLRPISPPRDSLLLPGKPLPLTPVADDASATKLPHFGKSPFAQAALPSASSPWGGQLARSAPLLSSPAAAAPPAASATLTHATGLSLPCALGLLSPSTVAAPAPGAAALIFAEPSQAAPKALFPSLGATAALHSSASPPAGTAQVMSTINGSFSTGASLLPPPGQFSAAVPSLLGLTPAASAEGASIPRVGGSASSNAVAQLLPGTATSLGQPAAQAMQATASVSSVDSAEDSPLQQASSPPPPPPPSPPPPLAPVVLPPKSWAGEATATALRTLASIAGAAGAELQWQAKSSPEEPPTSEGALQWDRLFQWLQARTPRARHNSSILTVTLMPVDAPLGESGESHDLAVFPCTAAWAHLGDELPRGSVALPIRRHMPTDTRKQCLLVDDCDVWERLAACVDEQAPPPAMGPHALLEYAAVPLLDELVTLHHRCNAAQVMAHAVAKWLSSVTAQVQSALQRAGHPCSQKWSGAAKDLVRAFEQLPSCAPSGTAMHACAAAVAHLSSQAFSQPAVPVQLPPLQQPDPATAGPLVRLPVPSPSPAAAGAGTPTGPENSLLEDVSVLDWSFSSAVPGSPPQQQRASPKKRRRSAHGAATPAGSQSRKQRRRSRGLGAAVAASKAKVHTPSWRDIAAAAHMESSQHDQALDELVDEVCLELI